MSQETNTKIELSNEKSFEQAEMIIKLLNVWVDQLDADYLEESAKQIIAHGAKYDATAVLNPQYQPGRSNVYTLHGQALLGLVQYIRNRIQADAEKNLLDRQKNEAFELMRKMGF